MKGSYFLYAVLFVLVIIFPIAYHFNNKLSLCDVGNYPSIFDGKTVRLKTRMDFSIENAVISDETCSHRAVVTFDGYAYRPIEKIRKDSNRQEVTILYFDVEIEGKFINKPFTKCCANTPFQFEVTEVFEAKAVTAN